MPWLRQRALLASWLLVVPLAAWVTGELSQIRRTVENARSLQCGLSYALVLHQILERVSRAEDQAESSLLSQAQILEGQTCARHTLREEFLPDGGVDALRLSAQSATTEQGEVAYRAALHARLDQVMQRAGGSTLQLRELSRATAELDALIQQPSAPSARTRLKALLTAAPISSADRSGASPAAIVARAEWRYRSALSTALNKVNDAPALAGAATDARVQLYRLFNATAVREHQKLQQRINAAGVTRSVDIALLIAGSLLSLALTAFGVLLWWRDRNARLAGLVDASQRTSRGELGVSLAVRGGGKVSELETAFNRMSAELHQRYQTIIDELEAARASAETSRRYLHSLTDGVPGALFEIALEPAPTFRFVSAGSLELMGISARQAVDNPQAIFNAVDPLDRGPLLAALASDTGDEMRLDLRLRHALTGELRWLHVRGAPYQKAPGGGRRRFGLMSDLTAQKQLEASLEEALEAARIADRFKSDFMRNVSHEIRTPMNAILGMSHLALATVLDEKQRGYVQQVQASAKGLLKIINGILDFSRLEAGELRAEATAFDLADVLEPFEDEFAPRAGAARLSFEMDIGADVPRALIGDPQRIGQVLSQLADNAIKFTQAGQVGLRLRVGEGACLKFTVHDTGIGIGRAQQALLFKSVSQGDGSSGRKHGGTGLGLVLCRQLVDLMGGRIGIESREITGASFWVELDLPLATDLQPRAPRTPAVKAAVSLAPSESAEPRRPFDRNAFDVLAERIADYDSEARDAAKALRGMDSIDTATLAALDEALSAFDFEQAAKLLPDLRAA